MTEKEPIKKKYHLDIQIYDRKTIDGLSKTENPKDLVRKILADYFNGNMGDPETDKEMKKEKLRLTRAKRIQEEVKAEQMQTYKNSFGTTPSKEAQNAMNEKALVENKKSILVGDDGIILCPDCNEPMGGPGMDMFKQTQSLYHHLHRGHRRSYTNAESKAVQELVSQDAQ